MQVKARSNQRPPSRNKNLKRCKRQAAMVKTLKSRTKKTTRHKSLRKVGHTRTGATKRSAKTRIRIRYSRLTQIEDFQIT